MVTVRVGSGRQEFCIHKKILCSNSTYFDKALSGQFVEAQTRVVELEDIHPLLFKIFVAWLYSGRLTYESSDPSTSSHEEEDEKDDGDKKDELADFQEEDSRTWSYLILTGLFILGDRLDAPRLKRSILDTIVKKINQTRKVPFGTVVIYAYANTPKKSPLRQLLVHIFAYEKSFSRSPKNSKLKYLPAEFLAAVMIRMGRRLPFRQCDSCYERALDANKLTSEDIDDVHKEEDQAPYDHNLCFYHEHKDEEEKNACQAAREEESDTDSSFDMSSDTSSDVSDISSGT
ncbi:uncharacterized protein M437DRAFT_53902 [Aureobasidium melanogenum CBS 110374]|uniref:BTB domain-containing protein n=1 Tax=Aureobasidium melanogenum (strain CBS 110374) TaxID=1043003 RepID=A0A074VJK4_AURM1|nr:uncharacterized protein M437DRAFT_53902 [Aureobasidium melanogenum CBS 110374]KEQ60688.1 hypothetical protein M437DRAFT_53902 [Aureobasidium melanogenum CBS 110374]